VLNALASRIPDLIGGSADLDPSTHTALKGLGDFEGQSGERADRQGEAGGGWSQAGRNLHFGVREHAMATILNGLACHGGTIPFGATFLIFSDYLRPALRLAAIMQQQVIYVFTHDSLGLGEDGTTHQPVEQLASLRAIPRLAVIRPADANETAVAWAVAIERRNGPTALILSRQALPVIDRSGGLAQAEELRRGAYVLIDTPGRRPDALLIGSGSEVALLVAAHEKLLGQSIHVRVISMPSWELFEAQPPQYRAAVLDPAVGVRLAVEAGCSQGWHRYVGPQGEVLCVDKFGESAPGTALLAEYGFTVENVVEKLTRLFAAQKE
jgi:transketolase